MSERPTCLDCHHYAFSTCLKCKEDYLIDDVCEGCYRCPVCCECDNMELS
jgi:hypothetical protein